VLSATHTQVIDTIERALYGLSNVDRQGLDANAARNLITNLQPAIFAAVDAAVLAQREACAQAVAQWADQCGRGSHPITVEEAQEAIRAHK
jgi:hypothetical protein